MTPAVPIWVFVGGAGAVGVLLRYVLGGWLARASGGMFPWETLAINVAGCLAIGLLAGALDRGAPLSPSVRMALMVGLLGGFTTFSSFALETLRLVQDAEWLSATAYVLMSNVGGLAAVFLGYGLLART